MLNLKLLNPPTPHNELQIYNVNAKSHALKPTYPTHNEL